MERLGASLFHSEFGMEVTSMANLDNLLNIDGVVAVGEFTADGKLVD